jgi:hypothetical protein
MYGHKGGTVDEFWRAWAAYAVKTQWEIYRRTIPFPGIANVETQLEPVPVFIVHMVDGDTFQVMPSGIAKPIFRG